MTLLRGVSGLEIVGVHVGGDNGFLAFDALPGGFSGFGGRPFNKTGKVTTHRSAFSSLLLPEFLEKFLDRIWSERLVPMVEGFN